MKFMRLSLLFGIIAFLAVGVFGISQILSMGKTESMNGCMFNLHAKYCLMTINEHISRWQTMFTSTSAKIGQIALFVTLLITVNELMFCLKKHLSLKLKNYITSLPRLYLKQNPNLSFFDILKQEFSDGILNPKIFSISNI